MNRFAYLPTWVAVDPKGCRCTDCLIGQSIPADWLSGSDLDWIARQNDFIDRTGMTEQDWDQLANDDI